MHLQDPEKHALVKEYLKIILTAPKMMPIRNILAINVTNNGTRNEKPYCRKFVWVLKKNLLSSRLDAGFIHRYRTFLSN
jgi:hypothetical protein